MRKRVLLLIVIGIPISLQMGCSYFAGTEGGWEPSPKKRPHFVHEVRWEGENLEIIAKWYTGDSKNWSALADANPQIDVKEVIIGNSVYIPAYLLKKRGPLPREFVASFNKKSEPGSRTKPKKREKRQKSKPISEDKDEFELFGPK
jgi:hypothetical protein